MPLAADLIWNDAAIRPARLAGEPTKVVDRYRHFAAALGQRLAVFQRDCPGDLLAAPLQHVANAVEKCAAVTQQGIGPGRPGPAGRLPGPGQRVATAVATRPTISPLDGLTTSMAASGSAHWPFKYSRLVSMIEP